MIRTILSPGVELKETDKSQYTPDLGTVPRALIMGFANKGPAKLTTEITSMSDFRTIYGTPTNEAERYFYNAADKMLGAGATVVAAKIPYVGDDNYVGVSYKVKATMADTPADTLIYLTDGKYKTITGPLTSLSRTAITSAVGGSSQEKLNTIERVIVGSIFTSLDANVFENCKNLKYVSFATDSVTTIGNEAFKGCESLESIDLPEKLSSLGTGVFADCINLKTVNISKNVTFETFDDSVFSGCKKLTGIAIPVSVTRIGDSAFTGCSSIKTLTIPQNVAVLDVSAFESNSNLETVIFEYMELEDSSLSIAADTFTNCDKLSRVYFMNLDKADVEALENYSESWGLSNCVIKCKDGSLFIGNPDIRGIDTLDDLDVTEFLNDAEVQNRTCSSISLNASSEKQAIVSDVLSTLNRMDSSIEELTLISAVSGYNIDNDTFLALQSGDREDTTGDTEINRVLPQDSFIIVDKTRGTYKTFTGNGSNIDCLGILPVVTTAVNAMAIAGNLDGVSMNTTNEAEISRINEYESLDKIKYIDDNFNSTDAEISGFWSVGPNTIEKANTLNSISKAAAQFFPSVNYSSQVSATTNTNGTMPFDHNLFSYIGIVVFQVGVERGSGCLVAEPIEAFAGSLLSDAKDLRTNGSAFIEDIVNTTSNYISIYVNEKLADNNSGQSLFGKNSILYAYPSDGLILGLPPKTITRKVSFERITKNMDDVFKAQSNILATTLDVVVDAGLSTISECVYGLDDASAMDVEKLPLIKYCTKEKNTGPWFGWRAVINSMKKFCEQTRKDCVFVADAPRFLSLRNQRKLVSAYDAASSVTDTILPKIKLISGINTSYGWGYTTWFKIGDAALGTAFWCPPSIFGAAAYITTRTNWNTWDAPAGMTRGPISVDDTSFEPDLNARNVIYSNSWNYALTDNQNGVTTLEGQKTFQSYTSAFDRINVRSLFLDLERRVFKIARNYIYEPNTADTRQQFVDNITPIFSSTKAQGGCYDYKIIADESINTPAVIDNNELRVRIGVQPVKTIEFILIEFVASRTGSDWSELVME